MTITLVLAKTPAYSETFFVSKIKGLQTRGLTVQLAVQEKATDFNLCPVLVAPKAYKNPVKQFFKIGFTYFKLVPYLSRVRHFIHLEKQQKATCVTSLKKIYNNAHILSSKTNWLHFGFATQAIGREHIAQAIGAKMAVSLRGFDMAVYPLKHPNCYDLLWKHVDKVHSISNYLLQQAFSLGLPKNTPYQVITPAVKNKLISNLDSMVSINKTIQITTIARLHYIKDLGTALKAMLFLKNKGIAFHYHIIGSGNKTETERYELQVLELGLQDQVTFHKKLSHNNTIAQLHKTHFYLQTSLNEGFCNAILEAQALGKLCIATAVGGILENIINNQTGWLVPKCNPEALANKIMEVLQLSETEKQTISNKAKQRVKQHFTLAQQQEQFYKFYTT